MDFKKVLITGGAGYVGSVLVPKLLEKNYEVNVLDLMIYGETLPKHPKLKIFKGDIRDNDLVKKSLEKCDAVIHLACISNDPSFELDKSLGKSINLLAFSPLVEFSKRAGIKRFIYASSSSVYGVKKETNVNEEMSLEPLTDYSKFKADCEKILLKSKSDNFEVVVVRPATVCGYSPRQRLDLVVNILTNLAYHKNKISVFGGDQLRPNIHIQDMCRAYLKILEAPKKLINGEIFNVGFENKKVNDIADLVKKNIGDKVLIEKEESNDNRSYHISSKKFCKQLNFKTQFTIEDSIKDLKMAFDKRKLVDTLDDPKYFNVKLMQKINLK
tara:strand:+ start:394 stop:1377 length:984 start_codon:yes stop_codon:yes gene_type:complete